MKIKNVIFCFVAIPLMACQCSMESDSYSYRVVNHASFTISYYFAIGDGRKDWRENAYPDTALTFDRRYVEHPLEANKVWYSSVFDRTFEEWMSSLPKDTASFYIFNYDTLNHYSWEVIQKEYKILQRYDLSIDDLHLLEDEYGIPVIVYPPSEIMKDMKMYPPYEQK